MPKSLDETTISAWARLVRAQQLLLAHVEDELKQAQLPPLAWYDVLPELNRTTAGGLRQFEIGAAVLLSKYNASRLLDRLEAEGLVERRACEDDRRGAFVAITREGKALLRRMWPVYQRAIAAHFAAHFSKADIVTLNSLMERLPGVAR